MLELRGRQGEVGGGAWFVVLTKSEAREGRGEILEELNRFLFVHVELEFLMDDPEEDKLEK